MSKPSRPDSTIHIRPAHVPDAKVIAEFNRRLAKETENLALDEDRVLRGVRALLSDPAKGVYFLAVSEGGVVGQCLITYEWSDWRDGNFWWLQSVYVREEFRKTGVFRALLDHIRALARSRPDVCGLRLYMDAHNARARATYGRLGFKRTNYELFEMDFVLPASAISG